jgi:hypothetical protein
MKKLFLVFLLLSGVGFSIVYYYWRQATHLPEWYTTQSPITQETLDLSHPSELVAAKARLQEKIDASIAQSLSLSSPSSLSLDQATSNRTNSLSQVTNNSTSQEISPKKHVEVELSNQEVNELVMTKIAEETGQSKVLATALKNHTTIKEGVLESGAVVNLAELPKDKLNQKEVASLEKVLKTFPFLVNQEIYVAILGKPQVANGQVKWDDNTKIKLGNLNLSISELAQRLGIPQEQLEHKLNLSLQLGRLKVNDMELKDNKVLLRGSVD